MKPAYWTLAFFDISFVIVDDDTSSQFWLDSPLGKTSS
jgi:hypothetical protein